MLEFTSRIRRKEVEPRIYTIVLIDKGVARKLWTGLAYTFEDALDAARVDASDAFPAEGESVFFWKPLMFDIISFHDLKKMLIEMGALELTARQVKKKTTKKRIVKKKIKSTKNDLIKDIIDNKDKKLLNLNKSMLTSAELKYVKDKLK